MTPTIISALFYIWLFVAISFAGFLLGRVVGYRQGWREAKQLYKGEWE